MRKWITPFALIAIALLMALPLNAQTVSFRLFPDFDGNGVVDLPDFLLFVGKFGARQGDGKYEAQYDLDGDGAVGLSDFLIFVSKFGKTGPLTVDKMNFPIRALHAGLDSGTNAAVVSEWEAAGRIGRVIPLDYIEWLKSLHVNWVGLSVALYYDDSMDSTVERVSPFDEFSFSDEVVRQLIQEFRNHGFEVYLTLAFNDHVPDQAARRAGRWHLGNPKTPNSPGYRPENWPWRPDHPDHQRFVAEFWETYTQQVVNLAKVAEDAGARLFSLGTETDNLFRTRTGG